MIAAAAAARVEAGLAPEVAVAASEPLSAPRRQIP